jgi:outer membrane protein OmpA-like peptidoglycan-associated protein
MAWHRHARVIGHGQQPEQNTPSCPIHHPGIAFACLCFRPFARRQRGTKENPMKLSATRNVALALMTAAALSACATGGSYVQSDQYGNPTQQQNRTGRNALIGGAIGVAAGLLTGNSATERRQHAMIGAGIGALGGAAVGQYQDRQERALRERTVNSGIDVTRQGDNIVLNLPDGVTFDFGKSALKPQFYGALNGVAATLKEYDQTMIEVVGHTDSIGSDAVNNKLSLDRANSVAAYLEGQGVNRVRMETLGAGKAYPIADNSTDAGRAKNRRVEVRLIPLKEQTAQNY